MNIIPSTFNENLPNCTVIGGDQPCAAARYPVSVLLLGRDTGRYREQSLEILVNAGFQSVLTIEDTKNNYRIEDFSQRFPQVKLIMPGEDCTVGDFINLGMSESEGDYLLVLWDDLVIKNNIINDLIVKKILATQAACFSPIFTNSLLQNLPVQMYPQIEKGSFSVLPAPVLYDNTPTIFPFDFVGCYEREKFINLGGFDNTIKSPYWQNLDFSLRAWLWGEQIIVSPIFRFSYEGSAPILDATIDESYFRFYLKNVAPIVKVDYGYIPISLFFQFNRRNAYPLANSIKEFKMARKWVSKNAFRFKKDVKTLTQEWEKK